MQKLLAFLIVLLLALPGGAHFIWIVPLKEKEVYTGSARLVFSDSVAPDANVPISKIAATKFFARAGAKGELLEVKKDEIQDAYLLTPTAGEGVVMIAGICDYGLFRKENEKPALIRYYAKTIVHKTRPTEWIPWLFEGTEQMKLEIVPVEKGSKHRVLWQGKPAENVEVSLLPPGYDEPILRKTDANGLFTLAPPKKGGIYTMRAKFVEAKTGEHAGQTYDEIRHHSTFTFAINDWLVAPPAEAKKEDPLKK